MLEVCKVLLLLGLPLPPATEAVFWQLCPTAQRSAYYWRYYACDFSCEGPIGDQGVPQS